jgi:hypothetical protein
MTDLLWWITLSGQVQQVDHLDPWISNVASGSSSIVVPTFLPKGMEALDPDSINGLVGRPTPILREPWKRWGRKRRRVG